MTSRDADIEAADRFARRKSAQDCEMLEPDFQAWLKHSERNREAYDRVDYAWGVLEKMHALGLFNSGADKPKPAAGFRPIDPSKSVRPTLQSRYTAPGIVLIVAAVLVSIAALAISSYRPAQSELSAPRTPVWVTYETGSYDSVMPVALPGNSALKLNSDTKVRVK